MSVRARLAQALTMRYGPHAHLGAELFDGAEKHTECMKSLAEEIGRSQEVFIKHYKDTSPTRRSLHCGHLARS